MSTLPTQNPPAAQPEEVPWWMKYAGRGMGTFGGVGESPWRINSLITPFTYKLATAYLMCVFLGSSCHVPRCLDMCHNFPNLHCGWHLASVRQYNNSTLLSQLLFKTFTLCSIAGFIVVLAEAPCCCMFLDFVQTFTNFIENRPVWHKAVIYIM